MIEVKNTTLKFSNGKGIYDLNFKVEEGEAFGYIGPNGAGKTTTIRMLMGFMRPTKGVATIAGFNCIKQTASIQKILGYIPGEISFFEGMRVNEFLVFMERMRGRKTPQNQKMKKDLIERFELDTRGKIDRMSKEMRQKLAIVTAFMHDPKILILDEPTSGLDPLMQTRFMDLILDEKRRGKTIFISSHIFEEIERTCDRAGIIKDGRIVEQNDIIQLKSEETKTYLVKFAVPPNLETLKKYGFGFKKLTDNNFEIFTKGDQIGLLVKILAVEKVLVLNSNAQNLEEVFPKYYSEEAKEV